ncbi:MAG TPA: DNA primase [Rhodospirillaceae bacterium]|nr:DNA primase [Rhodospirillaceae bacterium]
MGFPAAFLDEIRSRLSLVAEIGRQVKLTRKGREHIGLCPFHNEKTPSFTVNEEKSFYHCFGCGAHGDVITYAMQAQHLSFPEAVERLAEQAGLQVPEQVPEERERAKHEASLHDALEVACVFFQRELRGPTGHEALDYLRRRGLDEQTLGRFRLGYAPDSRGALRAALKSQGIPEALSIEAGLLIVPEGRTEPYDRFRGRVIFPITDRRGRVIAFGGRILGEGQPKYLNSPDTPLFHKGEVLYGLAQAREAAIKAGTVILCEGYMDVIALHRAGFAHAVAPLGTALTEQQLGLLWRLAPEPILCLDGDAAGQRALHKAALRALPLLKPGNSVRFATIPPPEDPDSLIRNAGPAAFQTVLDQAQPLSEMLWQWEWAERPTDTPERRAAFETALFSLVDSIQDRTVQDQYRRYFRSRLWESFRPVRPVYHRGQTKGRRHSVDRGPDGRLPGLSRPNPYPNAGGAEEQLLLMVIVHPALLEEVAERLGHLQFTDSSLDKLRQEVLKHLDGWAGLDSEGVRRHLSACGLTQILDRLLEARAHDRIAYLQPGAPLDGVRGLWDHVFNLYTRKDIGAELRWAEQQAGAAMSDETFAYLNALWSSMTRGEDS